MTKNKLPIFSIQMDIANMPDVKKPEIIVFAGPNGSGKSTITQFAKVIEPYINADEIKKATNCSDLEAAQKADEMRNSLVEQKQSFTFETVPSTERNLNLLKKAKGAGYFIRCIYVLTTNPQINIHLRIFKKRKTEYFVWENKFWAKDKIEKLTGVKI